MSDHTLYDDDILLWSEQQAAAIRKLGATQRHLPDELDIENVAEEIESVGRSELAAVKSYLRLIFLHLIKLVVESDSPAVDHWHGEIVGFHSEMMERYAPSMRQRIDIKAIWRSVREQSMLAYADVKDQPASELPTDCPFTIDDFVAQRIDGFDLLGRLRP